MYWGTSKIDGELNAKYPGGIETQKKKLEAEVHYVKNYERVTRFREIGI